MKLIFCLIVGFIFGFYIAVMLSVTEEAQEFFDEQEAKRDEER